MRTITINVSEPVYSEFQEIAKLSDRTTSELIRESMEIYLRNRQPRKSVLDITPISVGKIKREWRAGDDLLKEMMG
jgi:predicted CopG family antitoxin